MSSPFIRKSVESVRAEADQTGLHRSLGPIQLILLGIGCIVGAGVYVMTGAAAANYAGPAVILSFAMAAVACALIALCYAELASVLPVAGASYSYAYTALGEVYAWTLGWMLMFEFGLAGSALAVGFSGYLVSLLGDFNLHLPVALITPFLQSETTAGTTQLVRTGGVNAVAFVALLVVAFILARGISRSAAVNTLLVFIKVGVLIGFIVVGAGHVEPANWTPFIPAHEGGFHYGAPGIVRAASILFFAYLGFEAVATAASESRNPGRDVPMGILAALGASTLLYVAVALVMTGLVSYRELDVADPIAVAVSAIGQPVWAVIIKAGAVTGLASVLLVNTYAQSRVAFSMSNDGLLPRLFSNLHPRSKTPAIGTLVLVLISGVAAALLPISLLADLVSLGTALVFCVVALSVMALRNTHPEMVRPFKMPFGGFSIRGVWIGVTPVLALIASLSMSAPVLIDIIQKFCRGDWAPGLIIGLYLLAGAAMYAMFGKTHSRLRRAGTAA